MNMHHDMTRGPVGRELVLFSLPLILAHVLQLFYGVTDMLVVSRFVGEAGVAAVSNGNMVAFMVASFCMGFSSGGAVEVGRLASGEQVQARNRAVRALFFLTLLFSLVISVGSVVLCAPVLGWLDVPREAMADALHYTRIVCAGTVFVFGQYAVCAVLRALGSGKGPLLFTALSAVLNMVLDLFFVALWGMGTEGAALATVFSQAAAFGAALFFLYKACPQERREVCSQNTGSTRGEDVFAESRRQALAVLRTALPASGQMLAVNIAFFIMTAMLNRYGVAVAAASGIGLKINTLAGMPCWGIGQAMTAMVAQNAGAGDWERVKAVLWKGMGLSMAVTLSIVAVVQLSAVPVMEFFAPAGSEVAEVGVEYLRLCCFMNCVPYVAMYCFDAFALGVGRADVAFGNALLEAFAARLFFAWLGAEVFGMGYQGIYAGQAVSPLVPALCGWLFYRRGTWRRPAGRV